MRAIDADALMEKRKSVYIEYIDDEDFDENCDDAFVILAKHIINAPTLTLDDIVPHGRWVNKPFKGDDELLLPHCSECDTPNANTRKHCPECGAKMDLEEV